MILGHNIPYELNVYKIGKEFSSIINELLDEIIENLENLDKDSMVKINYKHSSFVDDYKVKFQRDKNSPCKYYHFRTDGNASLIFTNMDFIKILPAEKKQYMEFEFEEPESFDKLQDILTLLYYYKKLNTLS